MVHYVLPRLSYGYDELEPFIDRETLQIHHTAHHQSYVGGLNTTLNRMGADRHPQHISSILSDMSSVREHERANLAYFGGGFENHRLFWESLAPPYMIDSGVCDTKEGIALANSHDCNTDQNMGADGSGANACDSLHNIATAGHDIACNKRYNACSPDDDLSTTLCTCNENDCHGARIPYAVPRPCGPLEDAIDIYLGGFDSFQSAFAKHAASISGSGWCWLALDPSYNRLLITTTQNNDSPWLSGLVPLLGLDLWEHAYYLKHANDRAGYLKSWWHVVNWKTVEGRFSHAVA